jgi:hypothetical protein
VAAAVVGRSGQCTRTIGGVPSSGSIKVTVISSWLVMGPEANWMWMIGSRQVPTCRGSGSRYWVFGLKHGWVFAGCPVSVGCEPDSESVVLEVFDAVG